MNQRLFHAAPAIRRLRRQRPHPLALAVALAHALPALAGPALPTGAQVTAGQATLQQTASVLNVNQTSQRLVTNWQSFNIAPGHTVNFLQPSSSAVALNRVLGSDASLIQGALKANGQVFLLNPNGVLFGAGAQVDVGGLVASTLALKDEDFLAGRYRLGGDSSFGVTNLGHIRADDGTVALLAARVENQGQIQADRGQVILGAGSDMTLDLGAAVKLQIHQGALDALVDNGGAIRADGGLVLLTAKARDALSASAINHGGTVRARTLATGEKGEILLLGDMQSGQLDVGGKLDASAPGGGDGGFIETSAAHVTHRDGLVVDAGAARGQGGHWLVDPYDYTINAGAAATIAGTLNTGTSVTVSTQANVAGHGSAGSAGGNGDITVASAITKSAGGAAGLTLRADRNIIVNAPITSTSGALDITLSAANNASSNLGGVDLAANLASNGGRILVGGAGGNQTTSQYFGIGYALNLNTSSPALRLGTNVSIGSAGGSITLNGRTSGTTASYDGTKGGIYVKSGATVDTGGGNLYMSGVSSADNKEFGFGVEANSGTTTTFRTSSATGAIVVDTQNLLDPLGALGLVNNGNQARVQFWAPSVAHFLFRINGNNQAANFTQSPPCNPGYPNCGTMVIPGGNQSYTSAAYNVVSSAMLPIYIFTGSQSRVYNATNDASDVPLTSLAGPVGFTPANLGALSFTAASKNVGTYDTLTGGVGNPTTYQSGTYAVAYFNQGNYSITQRPLSNFQAQDKVYDGTNAASITATGAIGGDALTIVGTGGFASANVGNGIAVNVTGVTLSGADAGNYSVPSFGGISTSANITPAPLSVTAHNDSKTYDGNAYSGGNGVAYSGFVNGETASVLGGTLSYAGDSQGATNAGGYTITPQGLTSGNYSIAFNNGTLTISPAGLIAVTGALTGSTSKVYDGTTAAMLAPGNFLLSGFVNGDGASVTQTQGTYADANVGTGKQVTVSLSPSDFTATGATNLSNYSLPSSASGNIGTITRAPLGVTASNASKTYDGQAYTGGNGVAYSGFVNGETASVLGGTLAYGGSSQGATNAGSYTITPQGLSSGNYDITFNNGSLSVNPATLTYSANAATRTYGAANPAFGGSVTGFVNGETLASVTSGSLSFGTSATTANPVGSYAVNGSGLTANHGNYVFVQGGGNAAALSVTPAALTITASNASKTYDGLAYSGGNGVAYSGFVNGESASVLGGTLAYGGSSQGATNAGSYTITPQGLSSGNYDISFNNGSLTVNPATLTYSANAATRTYGAANPAFSGSVTGFVNGETLASATSGGLSFGSTATPASPVGSYAVNGSGLSANHGNYVFVQGAGNAAALGVTPAALSVTASNASKTYDGLAYSGGNGVAYSGFVNGETASVLGGTLAYGGSSQGATNAGSYTITPQGLSSGNYDISFNNGNLTVNPATLTYSANAATRTYGAANPAFSGTVTGFVNGETLANVTSGTLSFGSTANATSPVGSYTINGSGLTANNGNYVFVQDAGNSAALSVTPAALSVTANNASKTYDGLAYTGGNGVAYSGFVNGETASVLGGTLAYGGSSQGATNAGSYTITPQGLSSGNYDITFNNGSLTVNPATLTYSANSATRTYGAANPAFSGSVTGFVNGETLAGVTSGTLSFGTSATTASPVGSYAVNGSGLTANNGNYVFVQAAGNTSALSVTPAALSVTANNASKTYDGQAYSGGNGVAYSGFVNGETASVLGGTLAYGGSSQGATNAGSYTITPQGLSSGNYDITFNNGNLTVNPATLTYSANAATRTYGAANPAFSGSVTGFVNGETLAGVTSGTLSFGTSATTASPVGSYAVNGGGLSANHGNYIFVQGAGNPSALSVTPAALSVTANNASKTYDGQAYSGGNGVAYSGFVNGETASVLGGTLAYGGSSQGATNAGSYAITPQGLTSGNYDITFNNGGLTVNPATLTYSANAATRTYGAANPAFGGSVTGFVNGETLASATSGGLSFGSTATPASPAGSYAVNGSGLSANHGNYVFVQGAGNPSALSVTPAALSVTANNASKTYDGLAYTGGNGVAYSGFVNGETASVLGGTLAYGGSSQGATNAGSYTITPQGLSSGNYDITFNNGNLSVNPATLTYVAMPAGRNFGLANPTLGGSVTGFVNGESLATATTGTLFFGAVANPDSPVGAYGIQGQGLTALNGNYVFVQAPRNDDAFTVRAVPVLPDDLAARARPVPNFPDNALPALGTTQALLDFGNLNYVPVIAVPPQAGTAVLDAGANIRFGSTVLAPVVAEPTIGGAGVAGLGSALPDRAALGLGAGGGFGAGPAGASGGAPAGGANLASGGPAAGSAVGAPATPNAATSNAAAPGGAAEATLAAAVGRPVEAGSASASAAPTTASPAPSSTSTAQAGTGRPGATGRTARTGTAGIPVPSANGPLDIYVLEGGINTGESQRVSRREP